MEYLKSLRKTRKVSQQDVAGYLGITRQTYSNYENGNRNPDNEMLLKLGEYFDISVDALLKGGATGSSNKQLSDKAMNIATRYDALDIPGQETVEYIISREEARIQQIRDAKAEANASVQQELVARNGQRKTFEMYPNAPMPDSDEPPL